MSTLTTIIENAVTAIDAEIERLQWAKVALEEVLTSATTTKTTRKVTKRGPSKADIEAASRAIEEELSSPQFAEALDNVDDLFTDESELSSDERRAAADAKLDAIAKRERKNGKNGDSQRERILAMLAKGKTPTAIASELGTHVSYVYTVRKSAAVKAPSAKRAARNGKSKATK